MHTFLTGSLASLALVSAVPLAAQEADPVQTEQPSAQQMEQMMGMLAGLFQTEPLTAEQQARLPAATEIVRTMMPDGFYGEMMRGMMEKMMRPMMSMFTAPEFVLGTRLSVEDGYLDSLTEEEQIELLTMLDPAYDRRADVMIDTLTGNMGEMFSVLEPPMREGLSKAYAVRFDEKQLTDIAAFFATPTGNIYARESMALFADPQVMQASMQALPQVMGSFSNMGERINTAMAQLPAERAYDDLTAAERIRMAELLGVDENRLADMVMPPKPAGGEADPMM